MPERVERLLWIKGSQIALQLALQILTQLQDDLQSFSCCQVDIHSCVTSNTTSDWLVKLATQDRRVAKLFNKCLNEIPAAWITLAGFR